MGRMFFSNNHSSISSLKPKSDQTRGRHTATTSNPNPNPNPNPNHARGLCDTDDDDDDTDECRRSTKKCRAKNTPWTTRAVRVGGVCGDVAKGCDVRGWVRGAVRDGWVFFIFVFGNHHG